MEISTAPELSKASLFGYPLPSNVHIVETIYQTDTYGLKIMWHTKSNLRDSMTVMYPITEEKIISVLATMRMTC
jgi:hypothetical protein